MSESISVKEQTDPYSDLSNDLSDDLTVITSEIKAYKRVAGEAIFEIGRRLKHVKESKMAEKHGGWTEWLREIGMDRSNAHKFIKVYEELSRENVVTSQHLGMDALYLIATMPKEARDKEHELPSGETKKPEDMTVRELRELKRKLKEERDEKERLKNENKRLEEEKGRLLNKEPEVRIEKVTEYIEVKDEETERRLKEYEKKFGDIDNYSDEITASNRQDMIVAIKSFEKGVRDFSKRFSYLTQYKGIIDNLDEVSRRRYDESVEALKELADMFEFSTQDLVIVNQ